MSDTEQLPDILTCPALWDTSMDVTVGTLGFSSASPMWAYDNDALFKDIEKHKYWLVSAHVILHFKGNVTGDWAIHYDNLWEHPKVQHYFKDFVSHADGYRTRYALDKMFLVLFSVTIRFHEADSIRDFRLVNPKGFVKAKNTHQAIMGRIDEIKSTSILKDITNVVFPKPRHMLLSRNYRTLTRRVGVKIRDQSFDWHVENMFMITRFHAYTKYESDSDFFYAAHNTIVGDPRR